MSKPGKRQLNQGIKVNITNNQVFNKRHFHGNKRKMKVNEWSKLKT